MFTEAEEVEGWLFQMNLYFEVNRTSYEHRMTVATFYLGGEALNKFVSARPCFGMRRSP